jgi:hypothetical protein
MFMSSVGKRGLARASLVKLPVEVSCRVQTLQIGSEGADSRQVK